MASILSRLSRLSRLSLSHVSLSHDTTNESNSTTTTKKQQNAATVACLTLGRFVFTPQQRKASAKAGPPMQNGKSHKDAGDRLAEVRGFGIGHYLSLFYEEGGGREREGEARRKGGTLEE